MRLNPVTRASSFGLLLAAMCAFASTASAFDTGPHFDITQDVLKSEGFSPNAIATTQSANFFVDFYEFIGSGGIKKMLDGDCRAKVEDVLKLGDAQHFDDLRSTTEVAKKWDAMVDGTKSAAEDMTKKGDILGLVTLLGMSLHNVQDFYAHSNWVEGAPTGPALGTGALAKYGDHPTWLSVDRKDREALDVYTWLDRGGVRRSHGRWDSPNDSLNKDWAGRPHHTDAYICAWFATRQWVRLYQSWVNDPATWTKMQQLSKSTFNPDRDWEYARKISFYGGHWYGEGGPYGLKEAFSSYVAGTSPDLLINAVYEFMGGSLCITKRISALRTRVQDLLRTWGTMPYHGPVPVALPSSAPETMRFVQLRVRRIENVNGDDGFLGGQMDWYSEAVIQGQPYRSGLIDEHDNFDFEKPPYAPWIMTKALLPATDLVYIDFKLMELDYSDDDTIDINPTKNAKDLVLGYVPSTGEVRGDLRGPSPLFVEGKGDCDCARVKLSVSDHLGTSK